MKTVAQMTDHLIEKAAADDLFRKQLVADPKGIVKQEFDIDVPEAVTIHVHQGDANTYHLTLPASSELSEEQLEQISGGEMAPDRSRWVY